MNAASPPAKSHWSQSASDLAEGIRLYWMWSFLAVNDIRSRYRGSVLGPFWITAGSAVAITAMGFLFSRMFGIAESEYFPYLAVGWVIWRFIAGTVQEACETFTSAEMIHQVPAPFSLHVFRNIFRHIIIFGYHALVAVVVLAVLAPPHSLSALLFLPAFLLLVLNAVWISFLLGMVSTRYRDVPPIMSSILHIIFLITPVFWPNSLVQNVSGFLVLNPFFAAIDIARAPLLGQAAAPHSWTIMIVLTLVGSAFTYALFNRVRAYIPFWF